uniref:NADH dehydrogenase subunit 6 n=1 Tax=Bambusiphaga citricolorata TaxID=2566014 RepID=A0A7S4YZL2_9HEMI|nr:NADH dehydrogenase subunit 6 [Bambusiphaga citricolorata]
MKNLILMMLMNSMTTLITNHPISLGTILMLQSIMTSINMIMLTKNSWYSMILFITFSSGMMIMFMYMSSISSNKKFKPSIRLTIIYVTMTILTLTISKDWNFVMNFKLNELILMIQENEEKQSIVKNISFNKFYLTMMLTLTILLVLISISNLINSFEGPLKLTYDLH